MLGKKKISGWMVAVVLVASVTIAVISVPMIAKYNMSGECRSWIDSESYRTAETKSSYQVEFVKIKIGTSALFTYHQ